MRVQQLLVFATLLGGFGLWVLVAWAVALIMARLADVADPDGPPFLSPETWAVVTASGAAAGAVVAFSRVAPSMWFQRSVGQFVELSLATAGAMVAGATLTGLLALIAAWLRMDR